MLKICFLDLDGVLVTGAHMLALHERKEKNFQVPDPACVERLNRMLEETGAWVVVSSSWRMKYVNRNDHEGIRKMLGDLGVQCWTLPDATMTPALRGDRERGDEIQAWLDEHPRVGQFVILDDDSDMKHLHTRLVRTTFAKGFEEHHIAEAKFILSGFGTELSGWDGEVCKKCFRRNCVGFQVEDRVWQDVTEGKWNVICTTCFDEEAQKKGIPYVYLATYPMTWRLP